MESITSQPKVQKAIKKTVKCSKKNCKDPNQNAKLKLAYWHNLNEKKMKFTCGKEGTSKNKIFSQKKIGEIFSLIVK